MSLGKFSISDASHLVGHNLARDWVLDVGDITLDAGVDILAILESTIAFCIEGTILEHHILHIAERLLAADVTSH